MRLCEAILEANHRRVRGEAEASVPVGEFDAALPLAALTCIDARLNHLLPDVLGLPEAHFVWLRNAGNIITGPLSSTMRSLALACAVKGAKEIAIIGHSDCLVGRTTAMQLLDRLAALGVDRHRLPENLVEYFGLFGSERQNVIRGVEFVRSSPLIGANVPVHGLLLDLPTGRLESVVNGYQSFERTTTGRTAQAFQKADAVLEAFAQIGTAAAEELKLPDSKIGSVVATAHDWLHRAEKIAAVVEQALPGKGGADPAASPPPLPPAPARAGHGGPAARPPLRVPPKLRGK
jgi:carbonic anhydrase